jgi:hypothetical protein
MDERKIIEELLRDRPDLDPYLRNALEEKLKPMNLGDDDETLVIVGEWPSYINGSKMVLCDTCGARCSMAPTTQEGLKNYKGKVHLRCLTCFQANPPEVAPELPKQLFENRPKPAINISRKN